LDLPPVASPPEGRFALNILHFLRALRRAGLRVGPATALAALRAVEATGFDRKADLYWTLHALTVTRPEERTVFAETFRLFWRDPAWFEHMMGLVSPMVRGTQAEEKAKPGQRRAAEALLDRAPPVRAPQAGDEIEIDATGTAAAVERLKTLDFEQMTAAELAEARGLIARLVLPVPPLPARRRAPGPGPVPDWRRTLRASLRTGGEIARPLTLTRKERPPDLVALCDISGSMAPYSRAMLMFLHAASQAKGRGWGHVHSFTFGTRLTNITRTLAARDVDAALARAGAEAQDWGGGTRIGACLAAFNRDWSRRVLGQGAVVLLVTDGLERDDPGPLAAAMERLRLSSRRIIWVNPLLRWDGFAPRAAGVRAILPQVTDLRAGHNIAALAGLAAALAGASDAGLRARMLTAMRQG
jgi:hypothetical protein